MRIDKYTTLKPFEVTNEDFTILGFHKRSEYSKGAKIVTEYIGDNNEIVVRKTFSDLFDENGIFEGIKVFFEWLGDNDEVIETKEQNIFMDKYEASIYLQKRRERAIGFLSFSAHGTPIEQYLKMIFDHYKNEIDEFKTIGTDTFRNAVVNEADPQIVALLDIEVPRADGNGMITVRDSILHAI